MRFKIKNTVYEIHFTFFALILLTLTVSYKYYLVLLSAVMHELTHLIFIYLFSSAPKKVTFTLFGADILRDITAMHNYTSEVIINISAPLLNIALGVLCSLMSSCAFVYRNLINEIAVINISMGIFNLLPFYSFDGGNALKYFLLKSLNETKTEKALTFTSVLVAVIFSFLSVYMIFMYKNNISLIIVSFYMFFCIIFKK